MTDQKALMYLLFGLLISAIISTTVNAMAEIIRSLVNTKTRTPLRIDNTSDMISQLAFTVSRFQQLKL